MLFYNGHQADGPNQLYGYIYHSGFITEATAVVAEDEDFEAVHEHGFMYERPSNHKEIARALHIVEQQGDDEALLAIVRFVAKAQNDKLSNRIV